MKYFILLLFFIIPISAYSTDTLKLRLKVEQLENDLRKSQETITLIKEKISSVESITDKSFNGISYQIAFASYLLGGFSLVMVIVGIILGIYVTNIQNKIIDMYGKSLLIKDGVFEMNRLI